MKLIKDRRMLSLIGLCGIILLLSSAAQIISAQSESEIDELINILRDDEIRESDPERVVKAIIRLGELKAATAIDDLIQLITFERDLTNVMHLISPINHYPAADALFEIGSLSVPALVKVIKTHVGESKESENATLTLLSIFRESPSDGIGVLQEEASKAVSPLERQRLMEAVARMEEAVARMEKNNR